MRSDGQTSRAGGVPADGDGLGARNASARVWGQLGRNRMVYLDAAAAHGDRDAGPLLGPPYSAGSQAGSDAVQRRTGRGYLRESFPVALESAAACTASVRELRGSRRRLFQEDRYFSDHAFSGAAARAVARKSLDCQKPVQGVPAG